MTVFLDANRNGVLDAGERSAVTDASGNYRFANLGPGTYSVREVRPAGTIQTTANPAAIAARSGTNVAGVLIGNFRLASISGTKYDDANGNGVRDAGDRGVAGVTVFLDANRNGVLDAGERSAVTDASGNYRFANLGPGTYSVREVRPAGTIQTTANPAAIAARSGTNVAGVLIGNFRLGTITGLAFDDLNGNGVRDAGEQGLPGVTVFLDANRNGVLDAGERSAVTDASGNYRFANLGPGTYRVRSVSQPGLIGMTNNPADVFVASGANAFVQSLGFARTAAILSRSKLSLTGRNMAAGVLDQQAAFVASLYETVLHRAPDLEGLRYYIRLLQAGFSWQDVAAMFGV